MFPVCLGSLPPFVFSPVWDVVSRIKVGSEDTHLVILGNKVVNDEHLEPQLSAQLADILQQALDLPVMLLLQVGHLAMGTQQPEGISALRPPEPFKQQPRSHSELFQNKGARVI